MKRVKRVLRNPRVARDLLRNGAQHKYKRTSIGSSSNSFGSSCNKKDTRKKYRGQGR